MENEEEIFNSHPITPNSSPTPLSLLRILHLQLESAELINHPVVQSIRQDDQ